MASGGRRVTGLTTSQSSVAPQRKVADGNDDEGDGLAATAPDLLADAVERAVPSTIRETVDAIGLLNAATDPLEEGVPMTRVATSLGVDKSTAMRRARVAIARGFVRNLEERRGQPARLVLGEPVPDDVGLLTLGR